MKVAMYYKNDDIRIEERPIPEISDVEILVKMRACGICGSDVMEWYRVKKAPRVLGHEMTGDIAKVGDKVSDYKEGQRVFVSHHVPCNKCRYCLKGHTSACEVLHTTNFYPGGFAEYIRVPEINVDRGVYVLPNNISYEVGTFIEPLACVIRAQRMAGITTGDDILILGSGISGLLHIKSAMVVGAGEIIATDIDDFRLRKAEELGAHCIKASKNVPSEVKEILGRDGADIVFLCTSAKSAVEHALECVDRGGTICFFAPPSPGVNVSIPIIKYWRDEVTITTSYAGGPEDINTSIKHLKTGRIKVDDLITHILPLERAGEGFTLVANPKESIKVIIVSEGE